MKWPHTGAILVGGRSSRMGKPKHEIVLSDGRSMLEHIAELLRKTSRNVLIIGSDDRSVLPHCQFIADIREKGSGPLAGIEALLASRTDSQYIILPCDMPLLSPQVLSYLTQPSRAAATIGRMEHRQRPEFLPARINAQALPAVQALLNSGQRGIWQLMHALPAEIVSIPRKFEASFVNVNTPDDLKSLHQT